MSVTHKFIKYRFVNPITAKEVVDAMPEKDWIRLQRDPVRKKQFDLIEVIDMSSPSNLTISGDKHKQVANQKPEEVSGTMPTVEGDPYECPLCGFVAKNANGLRLHKVKHAKEE